MAKQAQPLRPLNFMVPAEIHDGLKKLAKANRRSMTKEATLAIETRIAEYDAEADRESTPTTKAVA